MNRSIEPPATGRLDRVEPTAAVAVLQDVHAHLEPRAVVGALWRHVEARSPASGLRYRHPTEDLAVAFGDGHHDTSYTLVAGGEPLGELTLSLPAPADTAALRGAEALVALALPALRQALIHERLSRRAAADSRAAAAHENEHGADDAGDGWEDALVLVSLDGFEDIRSAHGEVWAQTLMETLQSQIHDGLRDADSVFQIDEGLLAVLLPRTSEEAAMDVAGKIRVLIADLHLREGHITSQLTACMGVVGARSPRGPESVLARARTALAAAQQEGASTIRAYRGGTGPSR